jgi:hypothetical protein
MFKYSFLNQNHLFSSFSFAIGANKRKLLFDRELNRIIEKTGSNGIGIRKIENKMDGHTCTYKHINFD